MSETANIAAMSEKIADDLFEVFKWERKIVQDQSWDCVNPEDHANKKDHPSDCVFYYRDPYDGEQKYINTDLKSYAKTSINAYQIRKAILSLSYATNCAAYNPNWKKLFKPEDPHTIKGLLFVYNHTGDYNGDFGKIVNEINDSGKDNPKVNHLDGNNQIFIMSPQKIVELNSIAKDIQVMIGTKVLPDTDKFCYFHPNEVLNKNHTSHDYSEPATLEVLFSPWIIIKHAATTKIEAGYVIYYMKSGESVDEFIYLLDALSYFQILNDKGSVNIKLVHKNSHAALNLREAVNLYFTNLGYDEERVKALQENLAGKTIDKVIPQFSSIEIGLRQ